MQLSKLIETIDSKNYRLRDVEIKSIEFDSRLVRPGAVFIAIKGERFDGHEFINDAEKNGAVAVITQKRVKTELPLIVVQDTRATMGKLAKIFYGEFKDMSKIGITGTNGKTTTAFLVHSILARAGKNPGLIGTIYYLGQEKNKADRTTPESLELFKLFRRFKNDGAKAVVMEVSSHALSLKRVDEIRFTVAVFTNLTQDHLDFHGSIEQYKKTKLHIFFLLDEGGFAIFNADDPASDDIEAMHLKKRITYGVKKSADVLGRLIEDSINGVNIEVIYNGKKYKIDSRLAGGFNVYNILAAFATGIALHLDPEVIVQGIEALKSIRGRMERIDDNIFVDFAHTPAALDNVLHSLRHYMTGKIFVVFGCGGNRDREKRPMMGAVASRLADFTIITSDNPRRESSRQIIEEIKKGVKSKNYKIIEDRREAIRYAISIKGQNDIVLIAGKGHEEYQIIGDEVIEFDDAKVVRECLRN